ncbi:DODA-type extradiol aromatic ring-opening family dioxygenase [Polycladomyces subterraneus]|uniref:Dioxygenase n=1 Tax=Polycladomyces subterraneus TaxID=1016997 RepID=A0ABT8IN61_9BACL|nr:class III extradiol ring-cleavage dioxygenase [Polycladomyces subterraneus]MDN4594228.1 dioxygenase [Polycladomyces subterraneus]
MTPSMFIAHGSPLLAVQDISYTRDLRRLGEQLDQPEAILVFSAHWVSGTLTFTATDEVQDTIHDFGGFPRELYEITYPAKGSVNVAQEVQKLLRDHGIEAVLNAHRGLDHGVWVILRHMYPAADIPVIAASVNPSLSPEEQYRIGAALSSLKKRNILIIASGATVHNFRYMNFYEQDHTDEWAKEFDDWLIDRILEWDTVSLFDYQRLAPYALRATPDAEHFLPLFIAMGAGDDSRTARVYHQSYQYGSLSHLILQFN